MSKRYSEEFKESAIKKMMSPNPVSIPKLSSETAALLVLSKKWEAIWGENEED